MSFPIPTNPRGLNFPLDLTVSQNYDTPNTPEITDITLQWATGDNDERVTITLNLSLNEYIALASCVDVGSDIAYGDASTLLWWIWVRSVNTMELCEQIAECIDTNPTVQIAINNYLEKNGAVNPDSGGNTATMDTRTPDHATEPIAESPDPCDLDALWAGIREMVERIDGEGRDLLEDLAVLNDKVQQIERFISLVPIIGDFIVSIADFFTEVIPDLLNDYNAFSSPTALDSVACDIFEMVCNDCEYPTYDQLLNYFGSHSMAGLPQLEVSTMAQVWDVAKSLPVGTPSIVWYTINTLQCLVLGLGGTWVGNFGKRTFGIWASFGEDNPNDNWMILCNGCQPPQWEVFIDFATGSHTDVTTFFTGSWNSTLGVAQCGSVSNTKVINLRFQMYNDMIATHGEVVVSTVGEEGTGNQITFGGVQYMPIYPATSELKIFDPFTSPTTLPTVAATATTARISQPTANLYVHSVRIFGTGTVSPEWLPYVV